LRVDDGDPTSLIQQQVGEFLRQGKRTCDIYNTFLAEDKCYDVAIRPENQNMLFLVPDVGHQRSLEEHGGQAPEFQTLPDLGHSNIDREISQGPGRDRSATQDPENPGRETGDDYESVLELERENATNADILGSDTTIIHLKKGTGDLSKPAKDWTWAVVSSVEVPIGDPHGLVEQKMARCWRQMYLKPHDSDLKVLAFKDCYQVAKDAEDHSLYMMALSPQTEEEKAAERSEWKAPFPLPTDMFTLGEAAERIITQASRQAQQPTSWGNPTFVPPPDIHQFPQPLHVESDPSVPFPRPLERQPPLVESTPETHRDKMGRVGENRVGMSFQEDSTGIRKTPGEMRIPRQTEERTETRGQHRKLIKRQARLLTSSTLPSGE
jgi:hypothetical protein